MPKTILLRVLLSIVLCMIPLLGFSQELPPVVNYDPNEYEAGNQNWMISQADNGNLYIANGSGLLEYTGADWNLYPVPNKTIVRSVEVVGELIFTGAYMEVGYWKPDSFGVLQYTNLISKFPKPLHDGEQFWHIESVGNMVVFQSFEGLYLYDIDEEKISLVSSGAENGISNLFKVDGTIYFQVIGQGIYRIEGGSIEQVISSGILRDLEIMHLYRKEDQLHLVAQSGEFYKWDGGKLEQYNYRIQENARDLSIFSALDLPDGSLVIGTIEDGIFLLDPEGNILYHFNQEDGLLNNTVLSLFQDKDQNVWAGLDNGASVINLNSPFRLFRDNYGRIGSVYTSLRKGDYLYLGTNQGLYYRTSENEDFQLIEGTNGQVWSLNLYDGEIFCGHNKGSFIIEANVARRVADRFGTWTIQKYEPDTSIYVQGHYNGISLLKREGDDFVSLPMLEEFPHSSKYIVSEANGDIWIGNEHKGVYRISLDADLESIAQIENYTFGDNSGITSSIFKFNDTLYYSTIDEIFQYQRETDGFLEDNALAIALENVERISGRFINEGENQVWGFSGNNVFKVAPDHLKAGYRTTSVYLPGDLRNITLGYENITALDKSSYLLGVANGYLKFQKDGHQSIKKNIRIDRVSIAGLETTAGVVRLEGEEVFSYKKNNVSFDFSIPEYNKFLVPVYSFRLLGLSEQWSEWKESSSANFENLPFGSYEFQVRGRIGERVTEGESYSFIVGRPWYLSFTAIVIYFLLFLLLLLLVHKGYNKHHKKLIEENEKALRMKNLEAEQEIIKLKNEQLERDVLSKNKELAVSTMSLIKKNEFLTNIKQKLKDSSGSGSSDVKTVIKTIDKDISEEDNWNFFKEAFSNADKDFFKKMKTLHPNLTSNDLKLCAYLRLNLSSKEIAPLLNISVKSVEIKRYRLRKKMELPREKNLTDYILEI